MTDIVVATISGPYAISPEDGATLVNVIEDRLSEPGKLNLDFTGVQVFASGFLTTMVGELLNRHSSLILNQRLVVSGLSPDGQHLLRAVIANAKRYLVER